MFGIKENWNTGNPKLQYSNIPKVEQLKCFTPISNTHLEYLSFNR